MSTRGACGFRVNNKDYVSYNHSDSYPSYLGEELLAQTKELLKKYSLNELKEKVKSIKLVKDSGKPTKTEIAKLKQFTNLSVGGQNNKDWYCLLREMQGQLVLNLESGYMLDSSDFLLDSVFCEWAYILNLDNETFEIFKGFVNEKGDGRYDSIKTKSAPGFIDSYGVRLVVAYPFDKIPELQSVDSLVSSLGEG